MKPVPPEGRLTPDEQKVLDLLAEAHNAYVALPVEHPMHHQEWAMTLHNLQRLVMSRPTSRTYGWVKVKE
jgi:hypothetical protein